MEIRRRQPNPVIRVKHLRYQVNRPDAQPQNILEKIVWHKEAEVERLRAQLPLADLQRQVLTVPPPQSLIAALRQAPAPAVIAEVKKASPSRGVIRPDFDPVAIAQSYAAGGATALSVLTDSEFFQGSFDYLSEIRQAVTLPLLCKEFILYPYQIYLARVRGADAILLIAAILSDQDLGYFVRIAKALGMNALVEVHTAVEFERVLALPEVELIGINNRNLEDFSVDLQTTCGLLETYRNSIADRERVVISESGLRQPQDVAQVAAAGAQAVLVGESLMAQPDPGRAISTLLGR
ncbi:indole-3-glycerol phosphate synthase TrpC [Romeria aff. gracilis LEGE 07310]|uniref:Indole-3-glycerol phosphate synthase n=1 Tax=Vasconcelosia minhoensis LEGE 07310 TaxID=915328 RepID=A0A8J7DNF2_9CYAN|nr:indole-3-glycerol phosphate synthase TrpC [Romeria gracilis]MBE9078050.1 indole-3-glycerol phosphate synthase TrpC [Romeria aff. gracilis LEGE 07310]